MIINIASFLRSSWAPNIIARRFAPLGQYYCSSLRSPIFNYNFHDLTFHQSVSIASHVPSLILLVDSSPLGRGREFRVLSIWVDVVRLFWNERFDPRRSSVLLSGDCGS